MKEIVVVSGKGGTGKTVLSAGFAVLAQNKVIADCDVDAANLHLLLNPEADHKDNFFCGYEYYRQEADCTQCGKCREVCRFDAIDAEFNIDPVNCEGCAACYYACPAKAIERIEKLAGYCYFSETKYGKFIHAELNPGEDNSGKLVTKVKKEARGLAKAEQADYLIIDGPPGIGCPVNAALSGAQTAVIVTEPTLSGRHDLARIVEVCRRFQVKIFVVINKADVDERNALEIRKYCQQNGLTLAGEIPFSEDVNESLAKGKSLVESFPDHEVSRQIKFIWQEVQRS